MKALKILSLSVIVALSGCASYGGGSTYSQVLPGMDGRTTGAIVGGVAGSAISSHASGPMQSIVTIGGMIMGALLGGQYDDSRAAAGRTDCVANYSGSVDPNGNPTARTSPYNCTFSNSTPGNHNMPPRATPQ